MYYCDVKAEFSEAFEKYLKYGVWAIKKRLLTV